MFKGHHAGNPLDLSLLICGDEFLVMTFDRTRPSTPPVGNKHKIFD